MGDCQLSFQVVDLNRLTVVQIVAAGSTVADMTDSNLALGKLLHFFLGKDFAYQAKTLVRSEYTILVDHDPAAFLPTVLECIQSVIDKTGYILGCSAVHTKDTTFFMDAHF